MDDHQLSVIAGHYAHLLNSQNNNGTILPALPGIWGKHEGANAAASSLESNLQIRNRGEAGLLRYGQSWATVSATPPESAVSISFRLLGAYLPLPTAQYSLHSVLGART